MTSSPWMSIDPSLLGSYRPGVHQCSWLESLWLSVEIGKPDFGSSRQSVSSREKHRQVTTPTITTVWERKFTFMQIVFAEEQ